MRHLPTVAPAADPNLPMRGPFATSFLIHCGVFLAINLLALANVRSYQRESKDFAERIARQERQAAEQARKAERAAASEAARSRLEMEVADLIASSAGRTPEADELIADTSTSLSDLFGDAAQLTEADYAEMRMQMLDRVQVNADRLMKEALVAQVRQYVRDVVAPELRERIDRQLKDDAGTELKKHIEGGLKQAKPGQQGFDGQQRAAAAAAKAEIDPKLRERVTKEIKEKAIPEAVQRISTNLGNELEQAGIPRAEFQSQLTGDIAKALDAELDGSAAAASAWRRTDRVLGTDPGADLARARDAASAAADKLNELAKRQDEVRAEGADTQAPHEDQLAKDAEGAERQAADALTQARSSTLAADGEIDRGLEPLRRQAGSDSARHAAEAAHVKDTAQATSRMDEAARNLRDEAGRLGQVAAALEREQKASPVNADAAANVAADAAAKLGSAIAANAQPALDAAARSVDAAAAQFQPGKVLGDAGALARMRELKESLAQAKQNASEGRAPGSPMLFGAPGAGPAMGAGGRVSRGKISTFNREAYEKFVKDLRARTNPGNAYAPVAEVTGLDSAADPERGPFPAVVWAPKTDAPPADPKAAPAKPAERTVAEPAFKHVAFGAAAMMAHPITIDGDLADWGELTHPMQLQFHNDGSKLENGPKMYMRWSNEGLFVAYAVQDPGGIQPNTEMPFQGDCLEMWLDMENARRDLMAKSQFTHQLCFDPFGYKGDAKCTFVEIGRDQRGLKMYAAYPDASGKRGRCAAKVVPGGYTVECFIAREALSKPVLVPGAYLAVNFSVSVDYEVGHEMQWSAAKSMETWNRPDTWGDVLLLGADAQVRALDLAGEPCARLVPGQALQVEVTDKDMDMDPARADRVMASVRVKDGGEPVLMVLKETGPDTGVFRGSLNTESYLDEPRQNTLAVHPGDAVEIDYDDPRAEYGEQNRRVSAEIPVAHPVIKLAAAVH